MPKFVEKKDGCFSSEINVKNILKEIANKYCEEDEIIYVGIKGAHKQFLLATNKAIYIYKTGYMVGKTFGFSIFQLPYSSIGAIQLHTQFGGVGYIEIVGQGMQNRKNLSYWKVSEDGPSHLENCLSFAGDVDFYQKSVNIIHKLMSLSKENNIRENQSPKEIDKFEEIKQFKELLDLEIISYEEFAKKKDELLNKD